MRDKLLCAVDVALNAARHKYTDNAVASECFNAKSSNNGAVLAAGDSDNGVAVLTVLFKKISYPAYTAVFNLFSVKHSNHQPIKPTDQVRKINVQISARISLNNALPGK